MGVNEDIRDAIILRGHDLARFETGQAREMVKILDLAHDSILTKIAKTNGEWTRGWLRTMLGDLKTTYGDAFGAMSSKLDDSLKQLAGIETDWSAKTLDNSIPLNISISQPAPAQVWAAITTSPADRGHVLTELMASYQRTTVDKITGAIRQGVVEGETSSQMVSRIRGTRAGGFKNGVMQTSRNAAQALVSTAVMHVSNIARQQTYKENSDILSGWQWVATLDTLTCPECGALDGKTWKTDENSPQPPLHFNCRCTTIPVVKSWKELGFDIEEVGPGTRASMDGQVPGSQTYGDWLKPLSPAVQDQALGVNRAELFRSGVPIERFVRDGRTLTIDELRVQEANIPMVDAPARGPKYTSLVSQLKGQAFRNLDTGREVKLSSDGAKHLLRFNESDQKRAVVSQLEQVVLRMRKVGEVDDKRNRPDIKGVFKFRVSMGDQQFEATVFDNKTHGLQLYEIIPWAKK